MKLEVVRTSCRSTCTIGALYRDGEALCHTLEDTVRPDGEKVYGETAIPYGTYQVIVTHSPRFKRDLPLLVGVPNFEGVRIHPGNTAEDTHGCLLVGMGVQGDSITRSREAFTLVYSEILDALARGDEVTIEFRDA